MSSGRPGLPGPRFDSDSLQTSRSAPTGSEPRECGDTQLGHALEKTRDWLISQQKPDGHWVAELEGDTILESEYILLLAWLGRADSQEARLAANYIRRQQSPLGGWAGYPGGPLEINASVKAYFALKLTGHSPNLPELRRAREAILAAGGAEQVNSFTRYYLALLGVISYRQCPAVPPELILIPSWIPFNIYEMSAWSRTILVPLSLLWAHRPLRQLPPGLGVAELFVNSPEELPVTMTGTQEPDALRPDSWIDWNRIFRMVDCCWKVLERLRLLPLRRIAIRRTAAWILQRLQHSDGLGAIFPPIIWSVVALKCLGYGDDSAEVASQLEELRKLQIRDGETIRLQPCRSPVWDTALTTIALREAGLSCTHPAIKRAADWLLSKEVHLDGDWSVNVRTSRPGGWFFEYNNAFYPDVDDTIMVLMALSSCLSDTHGSRWRAELLGENWSPHEADSDTTSIVFGRSAERDLALAHFERVTPMLNAMWRGLHWILKMQCRNGGWAAFDVDNDRELFTRVPFADHNAMIDPPTADITARVLEMMGRLNVPQTHHAVKRAIEFVRGEQEADGCWFGRWGVNYIYGTWQALVGMAVAGVPATDPQFEAAANWLEARQQSCGGWGESCLTYDEPWRRGTGNPTPSQTAWALMGLMAAGRVNSTAVRRGVRNLLETRNDDGTWSETDFTGTGFPRVFYLRYHYYRIYFPLMALGRYARLTGGVD